MASRPGPAYRRFFLIGILVLGANLVVSTLAFIGLLWRGATGLGWGLVVVYWVVGLTLSRRMDEKRRVETGDKTR
jgi:hypothetical protein